jgi:pimeloyl-ACP methyl ester carboxylesterase
MAAPIIERKIELEGIETRALEIGGSGPPLVLLHGFADSADTWRLLLAALGERGRAAIALDMPGFGAAARLDREGEILPQLDRFAAAAVRHVVTELATGSEAIVVGNSLGGCLALRAAQDPGLPIAGAVPIAPAGLEMAGWLAIIEGEWLIRALLRSPLPIPEGVVRSIVARLYRALAFLHPADVPAEVVARFTGHFHSRRDVIRILATGRRLIAELRDPFDLARISCPVLLVWGDSDIMVMSSGAEHVLRAVPGAALEVIERCGHCPQIEATDHLVELLASFPAELARAA